MSKNNRVVYFGSIIVQHCEGNPEIFSGYSKDAARLFEWLYNKAGDYCKNATYPIESVQFEGEKWSGTKESKVSFDLTNHFFGTNKTNFVRIQYRLKDDYCHLREIVKKENDGLICDDFSVKLAYNVQKDDLIYLNSQLCIVTHVTK